MNWMISCLEILGISSMLRDQIEPQHQPALLSGTRQWLECANASSSIFRCTVCVHNPFWGFSTLPDTLHVRAKVETPAAITVLRSWLTLGLSFINILGNSIRLHALFQP